MLLPIKSVAFDLSCHFGKGDGESNFDGSKCLGCEKKLAMVDWLGFTSSFSFVFNDAFCKRVEESLVFLSGDAGGLSSETSLRFPVFDFDIDPGEPMEFRLQNIWLLNTWERLNDIRIPWLKGSWKSMGII